MRRVLKSDLDQALEDLQTILDGRLYTQGGYPAQVAALDNKWIVVADVDHDEAPELFIFVLDKFMEAWRRAKARVTEGEDITERLLEEGWPYRYEKEASE